MSNRLHWKSAMLLLFFRAACWSNLGGGAKYNDACSTGSLSSADGLDLPAFGILALKTLRPQHAGFNLGGTCTDSRKESAAGKQMCREPG